jgi:2-oxoglutarate dehydrogenase E2 component (dihydrolipoamide succinyltransferase)
MSIELRVPALGESVTQATIGTWLKREGDSVGADEPVVEVESEKATVALPAPAAGVLRRILKVSGDTVNVGEVIGLLDQGEAAAGAGGPAAAAAGRGNGAPAASAPVASPAGSGPYMPDAGALRGADAATAATPAASTATGRGGAAAPGAGGGAALAGGATGAPVPYGPPSMAGAIAGTPGASSAALVAEIEERRPPPPPSVRRMIAEHALEPGALAGSGRGGQVRRDDVLRALEGGRSGPPPAPSAAPAAAPAPPAGASAAAAPAAVPSISPARRRAAQERAQQMSPLRRTVARRLVEAQHTAAILTTFNEVDMSRVMALRERHQASFTERHGVKLGFMSFFVKAAVEGLRAFPLVNAEIRGDQIVHKDYYDIGVAVGGGKGLVVPVVRDADVLSFAEVEKTLGELAKKARDNRITMDDLEGGTFTISNGGIYGSLLSTPILNPPQSGILGLHKIQKRPMAEGDTVVVRPMMYLALSYDHRLVDGREAVSFLVRMKECIEDPERLLLGV